MSTIHLRNLYELSQMGAVILPSRSPTGQSRQRVLRTLRRQADPDHQREGSPAGGRDASENSRLEQYRSEFERIATWSEIFDSSDIATKKMI